MDNAKRASMREGPLAALFRKTEGTEAEPAEKAVAPATPPATRREPSASVAHPRESGLPHPGLSASPDVPREATRVPTPQERLRHAFSSEIPENVLDRHAQR